MAISAAGLPILLQASPVQLQDLIGSLSPGDSLKGRVVELLPGDQALVSIRGQNVVAQLPAGLSLAKGDVLPLLVSQASTGDAGAAPSLLLKLLPAQSPSNAAAGAAPSALPASTPQPSLAVSAQIEQALSLAKLPATSVNLSLARTLAGLGAPLEPATLGALSVAVESLLANERGTAASANAGLSPDLEQALSQGLAQFKLALSLNPAGQDAVYLGQAARGLEAALDQGNAAASQGASLSAEPAALDALDAAISRALSEPGPASDESLRGVLDQLRTSVPSPPSEASFETAGAPDSAFGASPSPDAPGAAGFSGAPGTAVIPGAPGAAGPTPGAPVAWQPSGLPNSADLPALREALAQWMGPLGSSEGPFSAGALAESARSLAASFADPAQGSTRLLVAAVQVQAPGASAEDIQAAGAWALNRAADHYASLPPDQSVPGTQALQGELGRLGLPAPQADLGALPPETVAEAVAWLGARGLPPQRPLVESVASWLDQGRQALPAARQALQSGAALPEDVLEGQPSLRQAYEALGRALDSAGLDPSADGLETGLNNLAALQGLNLESGLAAPFESLFTPGMEGAEGGSEGVVPAAAERGGGGGTSVREALLRLGNALGEAAQSAPAGDPVQAALNNALREAQSAVHGFNAVPLQAQAAPAGDVLHLSLPLGMNGALGDGRLSVTWRQGRGRELDDKEPVNVAVSLDTESLGPVTVHLRVWKNAAGAEVVAQDEATARFLATGAADLREGFARDTPFALNSLEFSVAGPAGSPPPYPGAEALRPGLSLSA